ncbi:MAG: thioredoxin [Cytophagales bacterium]|nr:MAG: thioredoxin [Cytophagales bacterium]
MNFSFLIKTNISTAFIVIFIGLLGCSQPNNKKYNSELTANQFASALDSAKTFQLLDVRTPDEFQNGHIKSALNLNWNDSEFKNQVSKLNKSIPTYVYCLSGGRSASAAQFLRENKFDKVFELSGGMMSWRSNDLPETMTSDTNIEMSTTQLQDIINKEPLLLIDFYADWCIPCQKMKPYLEEIENDKSNNTKVLRINADQQKNLCKNLNIDALPVLMIYKKGIKTWEQKSLATKEEILKQLH